MLAEPLGVVHRSRYRRRRARSRSAVDCLGASQTRRDPKRTLRESAKDIAGISLTNKKFEPPSLAKDRLPSLTCPTAEPQKPAGKFDLFHGGLHCFGVHLYFPSLEAFLGHVRRRNP